MRVIVYSHQSGGIASEYWLTDFFLHVFLKIKFLKVFFSRITAAPEKFKFT
jgi:hypothetical protein